MLPKHPVIRGYIDQTKTEKPVRMIIQLLCISGCAVHILVLSVDYFKFKTIALYAPYIPFEQTLPYFSVCLKLDAETVKKLPYGRQESRPIEPSAVIRDCFLRNFTSKQVEPIECHLGYDTTRTIRKRRYDCYSIAPKVFTRYMLLEAAAVINNRRVLYTFFLSKIFNEYNELIPLVHLKKRANEEFRFSQGVHLSDGKKNTSIEISYETFDILLLPPPYATDCINASLCFDSQGIRHQWCTKEICNNTVAITYRRAQAAPINGIFLEVRTIASPSTRLSYAPLKIANTFILEILSLLGLWISFSIHLMFESSGKLLSLLIKRPSPFIDTKKLHENSHGKMSTGSGFSLVKVSSVAKTRSPAPVAVRKESRGTRILKFILKSIVLIVFLREIYVISSDYFIYRTQMDIQIRADAMIEYPSVSHCIDIYEWFDHKEPSHFFRSYDELMSDFAGGFNYTLKQLFQLTPAPESAIKECQVRQSPENPLETRTDSNRLFNVTKFFFSDFMCYNYQPTMPFISPTDFEHDISVIYSIIPDDRLAKSFHYHAIVSYSLPKHSRLLVTEAWKQFKHQEINFSFKLFKYKNLPAPYDTQCSPSVRTNDCQVKCMNLEKINLVHFSNLLTEPIDLPVLDYVDLQNETIASFVQEAEERCSRTCPKACENSFATTFRAVSESNFTLQLILQSPKYPVYFFMALPVHTMYAYIYQLACSASFWVGFSLFSILLIVVKFKSDRSDIRSSSSPQNNETMRNFERSFRINQKYIRKTRPSISRTRRWRRYLKSRIKRLFIIIILTIGFCVQTFSTASMYFEYPVSMDTRMLPNDNYTSLKSIVCISIDQLDLKGDYTLHNIWTQSPAPHEVIVECSYRGVQLPEFSHLPKNLRRRILPYIDSTSRCNTLFRVKKFSTLGLICYEIAPGESTTDTEYRSQYQVMDTRVYAYFILSARVSSYNLTLALSQGPSVNSILMPTTPHRTWPTTICVYYYLHYAKFGLTSLPLPYDMGVYESLKRIMCMRNCVGRRMRAINVFSPYDTAIDPSYLPYESEINSIQNNSMDIKRKCESMCKFQMNFKKSRDVYFDTFSEGPFGWFKLKRLNGTISLWLTTSIHLVTETTFYPQLRFVDLVIFVGSLFAVWFGLSVLQFIDSISRKLLDDNN